MRLKSRDLPGWVDWQIIEFEDWKMRVWKRDLKESPKFLTTEGRENKTKHLSKELQE